MLHFEVGADDALKSGPEETPKVLAPLTIFFNLKMTETSVE